MSACECLGRGASFFVVSQVCPVHRVESKDDDVHCMPDYPEDDPHRHQCSDACWCMPEVNYICENGCVVWLHRETQ